MRRLYRANKTKQVLAHPTSREQFDFAQQKCFSIKIKDVHLAKSVSESEKRETTRPAIITTVVICNRFCAKKNIKKTDTHFFLQVFD